MRLIAHGMVSSTTDEFEIHGIQGIARVIQREHRYETSQLEIGEILVIDMTDSSQEPNLIYAGGIVTNSGGFTCHASLTANRFSIPCIVSTNNGTDVIRTGDKLFLTANGDIYVIE